MRDDELERAGEVLGEGAGAREQRLQLPCIPAGECSLEKARALLEPSLDADDRKRETD